MGRALLLLALLSVLAACEPTDKRFALPNTLQEDGAGAMCRDGWPPPCQE